MEKKLISSSKKKKSPALKRTRTTVLIQEDHLEKFKILAWWEKTTIKDLFDEMIENYLSSKDHLDHLINERKKNIELKKSIKTTTQ
jgi:hypothetical protein